MAVPALGKAGRRACDHLCDEGCGIHAERPGECRAFNWRRSARKSGWAMEIEGLAALAQRQAVRSTAPNSVTTQCTWPRVVTTPAPGLSCAVMRETLPPAAVAGSAMMGLPPSERAAPRMKSIWPPMPE
jgi:hypothetical protein